MFNRSVARAFVARTLAALGAMFFVASTALAQTDYYNLDAGRPLRVEDARTIERHALEWQLAPFRASGSGNNTATMAVEPHLAWGALPRTQVEVGIPIERRRVAGRTAIGGAGLDVSVLHALNAETMSTPGLAVGASLLVPLGGMSAEATYGAVRAIATRTFTAGRIHVNAGYGIGPTPSVASDGAPDLARWEVGVAADHTFPLRSMLIGAEIVARAPMSSSLGTEWSAATGVRKQLSPRLAVDAGVGRTLEKHGEWFITFGSAYAFGLLHRLGAR